VEDQINYRLEDRIWFDAQVPDPAIVGEVKAITCQMHDALTIGPSDADHPRIRAEAARSRVMELNLKADLLYLAQMVSAQPKFTPEQEEAWAAYRAARAAYHAEHTKPLTVTEAPTVRPEGMLFFRGIAFGLLFTAGVVAVVLLSVYHQQILAWVREAAR
jgi:hypothetical protein